MNKSLNSQDQNQLKVSLSNAVKGLHKAQTRLDEVLKTSSVRAWIQSEVSKKRGLWARLEKVLKTGLSQRQLERYLGDTVNELTKTLKKSVLKLIKAGHSYSEISQMTGVSKATISEWKNPAPKAPAKMAANTAKSETKKINDYKAAYENALEFLAAQGLAAEFENWKTK